MIILNLNIIMSTELFAQAKLTIDSLGESIELLDNQIARLTAFDQKISDLDSFTQDEKEKVSRLLSDSIARRTSKIEDMQNKMKIYEQEVLTIQKHIEERTSVLEDEDVNSILEENEELMDLMVGNQAALTLKLQSSSQRLQVDVD